MEALRIHHLGVAVADLDEAVGTYERLFGGSVEHRGTLGEGPAATTRDIAPARRLAQRVSVGSLALAVVTATRLGTRR